MSNCNNCRPKYNCTDLSVAASLLIGLIAAVLSFTAVITVTPAFLWVVLGIAVGFLAITFIAYSADRYLCPRGCACESTKALITGILGSILVSVILLGVTFAATSILGTILVGALLFFFSLTVTSVACLVKCLANCDND